MFGRNFKHHLGLFGSNHTHHLQLWGEGISHQLDQLRHELRSHFVLHDKSQSPGWLPNIFDPLVRAAFPEAQTWYTAHYLSNVTFDGPGQNHSHPLFPSVQIPTFQPPAKRRVPEYNPPLNTSFDPSQQDVDQGIAPQNSSNSTSLISSTQLQSSANPSQLVLQAVMMSSLTSGQQLQQVPHLPLLILLSPLSIMGTERSHHILRPVQGVRLYSPNATVFLLVQPDGNLVL